MNQNGKQAKSIAYVFEVSEEEKQHNGTINI